MAPGLENFTSPGDEFLQYFVNTPESQLDALLDFEQYIEDEGPFDGLMAFSQGAALGATYLIHQTQQGFEHAFRFAVFFCGIDPQDPRAVFNKTDDAHLEEEIITIPTAHIWGRNDQLWRSGPALSKACHSKVKEQYVHEGGHEIPSARDPIALAGALQAIRRTIARAC